MDAKNTLFILSDEHNPHMLGVAGHPFIKTPNLDKLANGGTYFNNAYCNSPICVPARASLATGQYVHQHHYWDNALAYDGRVKSWGHVLQKHGHCVESIGKLHYRNDTDSTGFDRQTNPVHILEGIGQLWGSIRNPPLRMPEIAAKMLQPIGAGTSKYNQYDMNNAQSACDWLQQASQTTHDQPWVLFVGLVAPHFPLTVPQEFLDLYPLESIPAPRLHPKDGYPRHPWVEAFHQNQPVDDALDDEGRRLAAACYYALCSFMDAQVGKILHTLQTSGLNDSTRVMYASDHGDNVGTRGLWGKSNLYEEAAGVPIILSGPDVPEGQVCGTPVSLVDMYPTILHSAGLHSTDLQRTDIPDSASAAADLAGKSLFEIMSQPDDSERAVLSEYHAVGSPAAGFMLRKGRYKYNYYVGQGAELFDLDTDPGETCNLFSEQPEVARRYEQALREILNPEQVDALAKADQEALIERHGGREQAMQLGAKGATPVPG